MLIFQGGTGTTHSLFQRPSSFLKCDLSARMSTRQPKIHFHLRWKLKTMQPRCVCFEHSHSKRHSVVQGRKWMCVSVGNWDELVLIGFYEMFGVISIGALLWRAGSALSWLGPLPSAAAPLHFLLFHSCARSLSPSVSSHDSNFPWLCQKRMNSSVSSHCASLSALWSKRPSWIPEPSLLC